MRFTEYVKSSYISEWKNYYISYKVIAGLFVSLKKLVKPLKATPEISQPIVLTEEERRDALFISELFCETMVSQLNKFEHFLVTKIEMSLKPNLMNLILNCKKLTFEGFDERERERFTYKIRAEARNYYKEVDMLRQFLNVNLKIFFKLTRRYKKLYSDIGLFDSEIIKPLNNLLAQTNPAKIDRILEKYAQATEAIYVQKLFDPSEEKEAMEVLIKHKNGNQLTKAESFKFGTYMGSFLVSAIISILLLLETQFFSEHQSDFVVYQFPIFRGALILYLYIFLLGVDVYVWERFNINYKKVFGLQYIASSAFHIMKRAFSFLAFWMVIFCYCALSNSPNFEKGQIFDKTYALYMTPSVWFVFIIFLIFPATKRSDNQGRAFVWRTFKGWISAPFVVLTLSTRLSIEQLLSFTVIIKDFMYTFCYCEHLLEVGKAKNECFGPSFKRLEMSIILFILIWRNLAKVNLFVRTYLNRDKIDPKEYTRRKWKFSFDTSLMMIAISTTISSYYMSHYAFLFYYWLIATIFLTFIKTHNDITNDWGFFQTKNWLRQKLSYPNRSFYYFAICSNFFLQLSWVISLSPSILKTPLVKNSVTLLTSLVECVRRCVWNMIKVEYEHLKIEGNFNALQEYDFPFKTEINMADPKVAQAVEEVLDNYIAEELPDKNSFTNFKSDAPVDLESFSQSNVDSKRLVKTFSLDLQSSKAYLKDSDAQSSFVEFDYWLGKCVEFNAMADRVHRKAKNDKERKELQLFQDLCFEGKVKNFQLRTQHQSMLIPVKEDFNGTVPRKDSTVILDIGPTLKKGLLDKE